MAVLLDGWPESEREKRKRKAVARVRQLREEWPPEEHRLIYGHVAAELGLKDSSTVARYVRESNRDQGERSRHVDKQAGRG